MSRTFLVLALFVFASGEKPDLLNIYILISGGGNFGGHPARMYRDPIKEAIANILKLPVEGGGKEAAVIWGEPKKDKNTFSFIQSLTPDAKEAENKAYEFLKNPDSPGSEVLLKGIGGAVEYLAEEANKSQALGPEHRVLISLLHFEISEKELHHFFEDQPQLHFAQFYFLVYPWANQPCSGEVKKTVQKLTREFDVMPTGAYCGAEKTVWEEFSLTVPTEPPIITDSDVNRNEYNRRGNEAEDSFDFLPFLIVGSVVLLLCTAGPMATWYVQHKQAERALTARRRTLSGALFAEHQDAIMKIAFYTTFNPAAPGSNQSIGKSTTSGSLTGDSVGKGSLKQQQQRVKA